VETSKPNKHSQGSFRQRIDKKLLFSMVYFNDIKHNTTILARMKTLEKVQKITLNCMVFFESRFQHIFAQKS